MSDTKATFKLSIDLDESTLGPAFEALRGPRVTPAAQQASVFAKTSPTIQKTGDAAIKAFKFLTKFMDHEDAIRIIAEGQFFVGYSTRDLIQQTKDGAQYRAEETVDAGAGI